MDHNKTIIPAAAIIPTRNRPVITVRTIQSVFDQDCVPQTIIVIDASDSDDTLKGLATLDVPRGVEIICKPAVIRGAAHQRAQALTLTTLPYVVFMDDDILLEPHCMRRVYEGFNAAPNVGGVNAMITNQQYTKPGRVTKFMYRLLDRNRSTWGGKVIGPAWNLLPEDDSSLPEYVKCDWLNLGCTMYRTDVLPTPLFPTSFHNYSLLEDLAMSYEVGKTTTLLNARTARIFHDSQPGDHKRDNARIAEMELVNRHYVMTKVMGLRSLKDYTKLFVFQMFGLITLTITGKFSLLFANIRGKFRALKVIASGRTGRHSQ